MGFNVQLGSLIFEIHPSVVNWLITCIVVGGLLVWAGKKVKRSAVVAPPKGVVLVIETIVNMICGIVSDSLMERTRSYLPFFGTLVIVMGISNLVGLIGLQAPTSNLSITATLAIMMFLLIQYTNIKENGLKARLKSLCEPFWIFAPLNILGDLALPLSLSLRLFGNLLAGTIIMGLVYMMMQNFMPFGVIGFVATPVLHAYFDIFSGLIQTYIFFTLATFFLSEAQASEE